MIANDRLYNFIVCTCVCVLVFLFKSINGLISIDFSDQLIPQTRASRHHHHLAFLIPSETRQYIQQSYLPRTIVQWNTLPATLVASPSADAFREGVCTISH